MALDDSTLEIVALGAAGAAVLSLGLALALLFRLTALRRGYDALVGGEAGTSFGEAMTRQHRAVEALREEVGALRTDLGTTRSELSDALRHVAVVRYDAFGDMGGRLSFSAALLDDSGDGLVLTSINGRSETRSYAKGIKNGESGHALSPEEEQALNYALGRQKHAPRTEETEGVTVRRR